MARLRVLRLDVDRQAVRAEDGRGCRPDRSDNDVLGERSAQVGLDSRIRGDLKDMLHLLAGGVASRCQAWFLVFDRPHPKRLSLGDFEVASRCQAWFLVFNRPVASRCQAWFLVFDRPHPKRLSLGGFGFAVSSLDFGFRSTSSEAPQLIGCRKVRRPETDRQSENQSLSPRSQPENKKPSQTLRHEARERRIIAKCETFH